MTTSERCLCGAREKNKCSKESEHGGGKMCLRAENIQSVYVDEKRLLSDNNYSREWIENEVTKSGQWFIQEIL